MSVTVCDASSSGSAEGSRPSATGRPSWSGLLQLSLVTVPVKAFPAVSTSATPHFNQLHADCGQRIRYEKRCPLHGTVDAGAIVRGYPHATDQYIVIEAEELEKLRPAKDKALVLDQLVAAGQIDPVYFAGRSLFLTPDGVAAQHPYRVLAEALEARGKWALGRVVLSNHQQLVLVRPEGGRFVLDVLHYPDQVRTSPLRKTELPAATADERHLACMLIDAASGPLDWTRYHDTTAQELADLVEAKLANRPAATPADPPVAVLQLLDALKQSVATLQTPPQPLTKKPRTPRSSRRSSA
jgi:DNA end-binding protein Ku